VEINCNRKLKGKKRERRRAGRQSLIDFSAILVTNREKYRNSLDHTKLMSWKDVILHLDEDFCYKIRIFKFEQHSRE